MKNPKNERKKGNMMTTELKEICKSFVRTARKNQMSEDTIKVLITIALSKNSVRLFGKCKVALEYLIYLIKRHDQTEAFDIFTGALAA